MADANPISGPYTVASVAYHQPNAATFTRAIRVTATTNNPLTLTGSYANNAGFMVISGSAAISASNGQGYSGADFTSKQIFPMSLLYVSASGTGDVTVLYNY